MLELLNLIKHKGIIYRFVKELSSNEFITYADFKLLTEVDEGVLNTDNNWLMFDIDGTEYITSKTTLAHSLSWDTLNYYNCVYGDTVVQIGNANYTVSLPTGINDGTGISSYTRNLSNDDVSVYCRSNSTSITYIEKKLKSLIATSHGWRPLLIRTEDILAPDIKVSNYFDETELFMSPTEVRSVFISSIDQLEEVL